MNILLRKSDDLNIENGNAQGQIAFWDATENKWVKTEISELYWDDVNKKLKVMELEIDEININSHTITDLSGSMRFQAYYGNIYLTSAGEDDTIYVNKDLDVLQHVFVGNKVSHRGDSNTYMKFTTDQIDFYAGGYNFLSLDEAAQDKFTVNPGRYNIDFIVNGDNIGGLISTDAGSDYVTFGGGIASPPRLKTSHYTVTYSDHLIYCSNNMTLTLPGSGVNGQELIIVNRGTGTVIVDGAGAETINGALTQTLNNQYDSITIRADKGTGWLITSDTR